MILNNLSSKKNPEVHQHSTAFFRIASNVQTGGTNPYLDLFYEALSQQGIDLVGKFDYSIDWLDENHQKMDAFHFHWLELLVSRKPNLVRSFRNFPGSRELQNLLMYGVRPLKLARLVRFLKGVKARDKRLIWTLHNLNPHEQHSVVQRKAFGIMAAYADLIICHDEITQKECLRRYSATAKVVIMPHGNYDGVYPAARPKSLVRQELGFEENLPIVAFLGQLRGYKGLDLVSKAFSELEKRIGLLIAGKPHPNFNFKQLEQSLQTRDNTVLVPRVLSEQEFADFAQVSDVLLLPYHRVTGSGALLAALTLNRGVVASDLPYFRSVLHQNPNSGRLFPPGDGKALAQATLEYLVLPEEARFAAARKLADQYSWDKVIRPVAKVIQGWQKD